MGHKFVDNEIEGFKLDALRNGDIELYERLSSPFLTESDLEEIINEQKQSTITPTARGYLNIGTEVDEDDDYYSDNDEEDDETILKKMVDAILSEEDDEDEEDDDEDDDEIYTSIGMVVNDFNLFAIKDTFRRIYIDLDCLKVNPTENLDLEDCMSTATAILFELMVNLYPSMIVPKTIYDEMKYTYIPNGLVRVTETPYNDHTDVFIYYTLEDDMKELRNAVVETFENKTFGSFIKTLIERIQGEGISVLYSKYMIDKETLFGLYDIGINSEYRELAKVSSTELSITPFIYEDKILMYIDKGDCYTDDEELPEDENVSDDEFGELLNEENTVDENPGVEEKK